MNIEKIIKETKPDISQSTLKTYNQNLNKLNKLITQKKEIENLDFLKDSSKVLDVLEQLALSTKKNYLVSIIVILNSNKNKYKSLIETYNEKIKSLQKTINDSYDENEKSDKQKENWLEYDDILKLLKTMKKETKPLLDKDELNKKEKDLIQQYLVIYLYSGKAFPPVRNDFSNMKIVNEDFDMDNTKNYFVVRKGKPPYFKLNEYKTAKYKGEQIIPIKDMELRKLINQWAKINGTGFLLVNLSNDEPMTANGITKYLSKIFRKHFKKNVSSSLLRSIYITNKYDNRLSTSEKKDLADKMGHSKNIAETVYNKVDD